MHTPNSDANARQVGGGHYKKNSTDLQHWDVVKLLGWDYFQGNITKYVDRHRKKKGLQDLLKAEHYLQKYMELEYPSEYAQHLLDQRRPLESYTVMELMDELRQRAAEQEQLQMDEYMRRERAAETANHDPDAAEPTMCSICGFDNGLHHRECPKQISKSEVTDASLHS